MRGRRFPPRSAGGTVLTVFAGLVFAVFSFFLFISAIGSWSVNRASRGWDQTFGTPDEIYERYPSREPNAGALKIEALTVPLGIDIATRSRAGRDRPTKEQSGPYRALKPAIGNYLKVQLRRPHRNLDPPAENLAAFLREHRGDLAALRRHLLGGSVPEWEMQIEKLIAAPIPNLLGHIDLHRLLIADALVNAQAGNVDVALDDLEASWRLNLSLRRDPILITQLIGITVLRMEAGALRQLEQVPPMWVERLRQYDFRAAFLEASRYEGWYWTQLNPPIGFIEKGPPWKRVFEAVAKPYVRWCLTDVSERFRRRLDNLAAVRALCDNDLAARHADLNVAVPRWNLFGNWVVPNMGSAVDRVARLELDIELTTKLLEIEEARRANDERWPESPSGIEQSSACPDDSWIYEVTPEGTMTIAFSREISWPDQQGTILPTRFVAEAR